MFMRYISFFLCHWRLKFSPPHKRGQNLASSSSSNDITILSFFSLKWLSREQHNCEPKTEIDDE